MKASTNWAAFSPPYSLCCFPPAVSVLVVVFCTVSALSVGGVSNRPALCTVLTGTMCFLAWPAVWRHGTGGLALEGGREQQREALDLIFYLCISKAVRCYISLWFIRFIPPQYSLSCMLEALMQTSLLCNVSFEQYVVEGECMTEGLCVGREWSMGCPSCRNQLVDQSCRKGLLHSQDTAETRSLNADWRSKLESNIEQRKWNILWKVHLVTLKLFNNASYRVAHWCVRHGSVRMFLSCESVLQPHWSGRKPDMHLKTCSCLGHRAKEQLQFTQSWLTEITSTRLHYVIRDIIQGNA